MRESRLYEIPDVKSQSVVVLEKFRSKSSKLLDALLEDANRNLSAYDTFTIFGALEKFLLERIAEPLIPQSVRHKFVAAAADSDPEKRQSEIRREVARLPVGNRDTLAFIMVHLRKVIDCPENEADFTIAAIVSPLDLEGFENMST